MRLVGFLLIERVKDRPELRIDGEDFEDRPVLTIADVVVVVEIDSARCIGR